MLRCGVCGQLKPREAFAIRFHATGERVSMCRACKTDYNRIWYQRNKARQKAAVRKNGARHRAQVGALIVASKDRPCADCGQHLPAVCMDFDHVRGTKAWTISQNRTRPIAAILAEIEKCEVVCANCHRLRTWERWQRFSKKRVEAGGPPVECSGEIEDLEEDLRLWDEVA